MYFKKPYLFIDHPKYQNTDISFNLVDLSSDKKPKNNPKWTI
jgi:hypothetical protein